MRPDESSRVTPEVEQNALSEWLAFGGNDDYVMLGTGVGTRLGPVKLDRLELQCVQSDKKLRGPLKTESPFSPSRIDKEVLNAG